MEAIHGETLLRLLADWADRSAWVELWRTVAFLGSPAFFSVLLPLAFASLARRPALRLTMLFVTSATVAEVLKKLIDRPRPDLETLGLAGPLEHAGAFENSALPSGHALMAVVLWGWLALRAPTRTLRPLAVAVILLISFSRLALLRHDLLDVGAGWAVGAALLTLLHRADRAWGLSLSRRPGLQQAGLWLLGCAVAQLALGLEVTALVLGVGAGLGAGAVAAGRLRPRRVRPAWPTAAARAVLGVLGVAAVRALAGPEEGWSQIALFAIYLGGALWVALILPLLLGGMWVTRWE